VSFVKHGIVIPYGISGAADSVGASMPVPIVYNGRVYCYYTGYYGGHYRVCLAVSKDGFHFTKMGVVLPEGVAGDADEVNRWLAGVCVSEGRVWAYYAASKSGVYRMFLATSKDGVHFTRKGCVFERGSGAAYDANGLSVGGAAWRNGRIVLYHTGMRVSTWRGALATSKDGHRFTKIGVVLPVGGAGEYDVTHAFYPCAYTHQGQWSILYSAEAASGRRLALATGKDGIHLLKHGVVVPLGASGESDDVYLTYGRGVWYAGRLFVYYAAYDGFREAIALATSKDGF
jgi:predicted GH43/DUF377 family glycosyl hydrolase